MIKFDSQFTLTIDGKGFEAGKTIDVINPATEEVFAHAPDTDADQLDTAIQSAQQAFKTWSATDIKKRQTLVKQAGDVIIENVNDLATLLTQEQGKPLKAAQGEIYGSGMFLHGYSQMTPAIEVLEDSDTRRVEIHRAPLGVVCGITPWNYPVILSIWKMGPCLVAGNTMVLKPSPFTPLTMLKIGELLREVLPPGVLNVLSGGDNLGPLMTAHPGFAKISFTGSTQTGKNIMQGAAPTLKHLTLELGGNDAAIVLPDVDVEKVARPIFNAAFVNSGQTCFATKRLYVHETIYDRLFEKLTEIARSVKVGVGTEDDTELGPIQNSRQYERVLKLLEDARATNLNIVTGAEIPAGKGYFVPVTLIDNPPEASRAVQEEAFGPVLPVLKYSDLDEVIERANNTDYGLTGVVWSNDNDKAKQIALRLDAGTIWVNEHMNLSPAIPLNGHKQSGLGVENGMLGLLEYTNPQTIHIPK